jgi:hypothetical protein
MLKLHCEYTDTFGGEANYSWVRRAEISLPDGSSDRKIVQMAKKELGLTGMRCRTFNHGDSWELRPYGECTVAFINIH